MDASLEFLLLAIFFFFSHMLLAFGIIKGNKKKRQLEYFDLQKQHCHNKKLLEMVYILISTIFNKRYAFS